ncbi:MAG: cell wall-active antibiotics response protein [Dictyoglomus sp.]|nr:cell wall-active antibiotics response protein [Dictyoglomus sp.]MCX7942155.1 cell wall-active antibiotics response protein [Dictyoglomaceae bacterium]MDW8188514.1 DUF5668 domain-containing protein [Dictyoglomus sp.]
MRKISLLGIFLIILGAILLASELGYLNIKWYDILKFWPVIFIFWGIDILMGEKRWFLWIALLVLIFFLSAIFFFMPFRMHKGIYRDWFLPYDPNIKSMEVTLKVGLRNLYIRPSFDKKSLISISSLREFDIKERRKIKGENAILDIEIENNFSSFFSEEGAIDVYFPSNIDINLTLEAGVGSCKLDFRGLKLNYLNIKGGVGNVSVWLSKTTSKVEINSGIGNITVYIPEGVILDLQTETGIGKISVDSEITRVQEGKSSDIIYLKAKSGIGNINIKASKEII